MSGSEEKKSVQDHHLDAIDQHHQADHQQLGLNSSAAAPPDPDPTLDSQLPSHDLDQQTINDELQDREFVNAELQNREIINEELKNLALEEGGGKEEDVEGEEGKEDEREMDHGGVIEGEAKNENESLNGEEGINDGTYKRNEDEIAKGENDMDDNQNDRRGSDEEGAEVDDSGGGHSTAVDVSNDGTYRRYLFPVRPDAEDCSYYMRTGNCKFGSSCKFNHPPRRRTEATMGRMEDKEENPEQTECKYYLRSGGCKFGAACRYTHSRGKTPVAPYCELNFLGLPIRAGEKECPYYMRTGSCKYGSNCRFNHPDPSAVGAGDSAGYGNGASVTIPGGSQSMISSWSLPRATKETAPLVPMMLSPARGVPSSNSEWNRHQPTKPHMNLAADRRLPTPPAFSLNNPTRETNFYTHHQQPMMVEEFPERPGQPECSYFMKTGDCKFRSGCKFHHPKIRMPKAPPCTLSDKGLPLRPDQIVCTHYSRYGICKFGPACKFDHPVNFAHSPSAVPGPDHSPPPPPVGNSDDGWG